MYRETFHSTLSKARRDRRLSLRTLSEVTGINFVRLWRLEKSIALPTEKERSLLNAVLTPKKGDLLYLDSRPDRFIQKLRMNGRDLDGEIRPYFPPADRESRHRCYSAKSEYSDEMKWLTSIVEAREDFSEVNCFCENLSLDSALECLYVSLLFARGARPALVGPNTLPPWLPNPIVCPKERVEVGHRPLPCFLTENATLFPQVTFSTPKQYTIDFLVCAEEGWQAVEIDGNGHDSRKNAVRESALKLPHVRLTEETVLELVHKQIANLLRARPGRATRTLEDKSA